MPMTREQLEQDLVTFRDRMKQCINDANACRGVTQYLELQLAMMDAETKLIRPSGADIAAVGKTKE